MAESEGFEPPVAFRLRLISSQVHSTGLCQLSVAMQAVTPASLTLVPLGGQTMAGATSGDRLYRPPMVISLVFFRMGAAEAGRKESHREQQRLLPRARQHRQAWRRRSW